MKYKKKGSYDILKDTSENSLGNIYRAISVVG